MTHRIQKLREILKSESYKANRTHIELNIEATPGVDPLMQESLVFRTTVAAETPYWHEGDRIGFNRRNAGIYRRPFRVKGDLIPGNVVPDYEKVLKCGMNSIRQEALDRMKTATDEELVFLNALLHSLDTAISYAKLCLKTAEEQGLDDIAATLRRVPLEAPTTLLEACVVIKFLQYTLRLARVEHVTLGRFDKYMRRFYYADLERGLTREALLETVEELFLSLNFDSDLYPGIQKGDNGQSMVLGGCGSFDDFTHLCMEAALELNLIDPKINLRVDKTTPDEVYHFATLMTKQGMGFPQYCNDDVVIPGLIALGYDPEDAADYAVAACWEHIIPGKGVDIPNITEINYPAVIRRVLAEHLPTSKSFEELMDHVTQGILAACEDLMERGNRKRPLPSPYLSAFIDGCIRDAKDHTKAGKYHNYGSHGIGISTAADSLAAVKKVVFEDQAVSAEELLNALECNFEGYETLRNRLLACPRMGNNDPYVDSLAYALMDTFSSINGKPNSSGGIFRAGTGSAMHYHQSAVNVGATPDGRLAGQPFSCSYSPSIEARIDGPLSCIKSFTGYDLKKVINGGPMTIELHSNVFRNDEGIRKVAMLVKAFVLLGGHQLQLNSINRDVLLDALDHPENHKNLIVRVWGWSGYFNELEMPYKQHVIKRTEFTV